MSRPSKDATFLEMAATLAKRTTCLRRGVGCVLVNAHGEVLATGYNGVAHGLPHCNESIGHRPVLEPYARKIDPVTWLVKRTPETPYPHACPAAHAPSGTQLDGCEAIHAEQNALLQCRDVRAIETCYVTVSPCLTCTKLLLNTGCRRIVAAAAYAHDAAARALWERAGREWVVGTA